MPWRRPEPAGTTAIRPLRIEFSDADLKDLHTRIVHTRWPERETVDDDTQGPNGIEDLDSEPATYTSVGDPCGDHQYPEAFLSPSQFIAAHHF